LISELVTRSHTLLVGDVLDRLKGLQDGSIHCCVTSPPYWGLRDYGTATWSGGDPACEHGVARWEGPKQTQGAQSGHASKADRLSRRQCKCGAVRTDRQLGLEETPEEYVDRLVTIFREVRRVLRSDGVLWLNLGDCYASKPNGPAMASSTLGGSLAPHEEYRSAHALRSTGLPPGIKHKDIVGIPWLTAFSLRADGWYLRQEVIWAKTVPMPESVRDRCTRSHETVFMLTKQPTYFYDPQAIRTPISEASNLRLNQKTFHTQTGGEKDYGNGTNANRSARKIIENLKFKHDSHTRMSGDHEGVRSANHVFGDQAAVDRILENGSNRRDVWTLGPAPSSLGHHAMFPPQLPLLCIKAGSSERGCCPRCGAPWTRQVADTGVEQYSANGSTFVDGKTAESQRRASKKPRTIKVPAGWVPACECGIAETVPCRVLDPFHGSGTTGAVAEYLGRHYTGIELNAEYLDIYDQRCAEVRRSLIGGEPPEKSTSTDQLGLFGEA